MKYGIARFVVNNGGRYSVMYSNDKVNSILDDSIYNYNIKEDGFTCVYFFTMEDDVDLSNQIYKYDIKLLSVQEAINWIKTNTNLKEIEYGKFLLSKGDNILSTQDIYLIIN